MKVWDSVDWDFGGGVGLGVGEGVFENGLNIFSGG